MNQALCGQVTRTTTMCVSRSESKEQSRSLYRSWIDLSVFINTSSARELFYYFIVRKKNVHRNKQTPTQSTYVVYSLASYIHMLSPSIAATEIMSIQSITTKTALPTLLNVLHQILSLHIPCYIISLIRSLQQSEQSPPHSSISPDTRVWPSSRFSKPKSGKTT